ncbi:MAG: hypothetical protein ACON4U_02960 [Myxococcota bacterium]
MVIFLVGVLRFSAMASDKKEHGKCVMSHIAHSDGQLSEAEEKRLSQIYNLMGEEKADFKAPCKTDWQTTLDFVSDAHDNIVLNVLFMAGYVATADGINKSIEKELIEDLLEAIGRQRNAEPLLKMCEGEIPHNPNSEKLRWIYSIGNDDNLKEEMLANCIFRSLVHSDGTYSEHEKAYANAQIKEIQSHQLNHPCQIPIGTVTNEIEWLENPVFNAWLVTNMGSLAQADGKTSTNEDILITGVLNDLNKSTDLEKLYGLTTLGFSEKTMLKVDEYFQFGAGEKIKSSFRSELPAHIKSIKSAQLAHELEHDIFVECPSYPSTPSTEPQMWVVSESGGFETIRWMPDGDVRGSYSVTTTASDFTITGISDIDGDSVQATYVATKSTSPKRLTAEDVY